MANERAGNRTPATSAALSSIVCGVDRPCASLVLSFLPCTVGSEVVRGPSL